jgi:hypothetical protein
MQKGRRERWGWARGGKHTQAARRRSVNTTTKVATAAKGSSAAGSRTDNFTQRGVSPAGCNLAVDTLPYGQAHPPAPLGTSGADSAQVLSTRTKLRQSC